MEQPPAVRKRILVIDDEEDLCLSIRANLEILGSYEVVIATNGQKGLEMARLKRPDIILLDIMMPGMSGLEVLKKLKANLQTSRIPVLMLTAKVDTDSKREAFSHYNDDYIEKPAESQHLKERIEKALSRIGCA